MANLQRQQNFIWEGVDIKGIQKTGEIKASNRQFVHATLMSKGIKVTRIRKKYPPIFKPNITPIHITQFTRHLATMIQSGIPIIQSLELIATTYKKHPKLKDLILDLKTDIDCGSTLSHAFQKHPKYFDDLYIGLIKAGEYAGKLDTMLDNIATYREKNEALKNKIKKSLLYPALILITTIVVLSIMLIWVVPQFEAVFNTFEADLPPFTLFVIHLSEWVQRNGWFIIITILGLQLVLPQIRKHSVSFHRLTNQLIFKIPIIGTLLYQAIIARFSRTLAILFAAGIPLIEGMDSLALSTANKIYIEATLAIKHDINKGMQLHIALQKTNVFPDMLVQMIKIGEETGQLEQMLTRAADHYETQVDNLQDMFSRQIEPLIILFLGIIVGGIIISLYLPIFTIGSVM